MHMHTEINSVQSVKEALTANLVLALFHNLEIVVLDVLLQRQTTGELKPVAYVSRAMTPTEMRYAQIEKEALAFMWACERLSDYLLGMQFNIQTDHKPLVPLFSSKHLKELPVRVRRFQMCMMCYQFTMSHAPGKNLTIADVLSRSPAASSPTRADDFYSRNYCICKLNNGASPSD